MGGTSKVTLLRLPGHRSIEGDEQTYGLTTRGSALGSPSVSTPVSHWRLLRVGSTRTTMQRPGGDLFDALGEFGPLITNPDHGSSCARRVQKYIRSRWSARDVSQSFNPHWGGWLSRFPPDGFCLLGSCHICHDLRRSWHQNGVPQR